MRCLSGGQDTVSSFLLLFFPFSLSLSLLFSLFVTHWSMKTIGRKIIFSSLCFLFVCQRTWRQLFSICSDRHTFICSSIKLRHLQYVVLLTTSTDIGIDVGHLFNIVWWFDKINLSTWRWTRIDVQFNIQSTSLLSTNSSTQINCSTVCLWTQFDTIVRLWFWFLWWYVVVHR